MTSLLVTGSSGTLGTALSESLLSSQFNLVGLDQKSNPWNPRVDDQTTCTDLLDPREVQHLPESVDTIIHLAAHSRVQPLIDNPQLGVENLQMTQNTLEYARSVNANFVYASSREVYGPDAPNPSEIDTTIDSAHNPYAASKIAGEALTNAYQHCYGLDTCVLRFGNIYGRYDATDRVVPAWIAEAIHGGTLTIYGPETILDLVHIDDAVNAIRKTINRLASISGSTYTIASGEGTSLRELADIIVTATNSQASISSIENRQGEASRFVADLTHARNDLDYTPKIDIKSGIDDAASWYLDRPGVLNEILNGSDPS